MKTKKSMKKSRRGSKFNRTSVWMEKHDQNNQGQYIGNVNTGILHNPDCRHVQRMHDINKILTDNLQALYRPCAHCQPDKRYLLTVLRLSNLQDKAILCTDSSILKIFETGCKNDGNTLGMVLMYPDNTHGIKVRDQPGKWHTYFHCEFCKQNTPYRIAQQHLKIGEIQNKTSAGIVNTI